MYPNLKREMGVYGISNEMIADFLGQHRNTVSNKINGSGSFSIEDSINIRNKFFSYATLEYLFKKIGKEEEKSKTA